MALARMYRTPVVPHKLAKMAPVPVTGLLLPPPPPLVLLLAVLSEEGVVAYTLTPPPPRSMTWALCVLLRYGGSCICCVKEEEGTIDWIRGPDNNKDDDDDDDGRCEKPYTTFSMMASRASTIEQRIVVLCVCQNMIDVVQLPTTFYFIFTVNGWQQ